MEAGSLPSDTEGCRLVACWVEVRLSGHWPGALDTALQISWVATVPNGSRKGAGQAWNLKGSCSCSSASGRRPERFGNYFEGGSPTMLMVAATLSRSVCLSQAVGGGPSGKGIRQTASTQTGTKIPRSPRPSGIGPTNMLRSRRRVVRATRSRAVAGRIVTSEIFRPEPCVFGDLGQRCRPDLLAVVEAEREVPPAWPLQLSARAHLLLQRPADSEQRSVDSSGFRCAPGAHAANKTFSGCGISSPLSIMSART